MPYLVAVNGPEAGRRFELQRGECILGRHPDCQIVIDVGAVSRHHCKITQVNGELLIEDLKSRNGTFVNDQVLEESSKLQHGDQIRICDVVFTYHEEGFSSSSAADESSSKAIIVDDDEKSGSTIMSKLDVTSSRSGTQIAASAEAKLNALIEIMQSLGRAISLDDVLRQVLDSLFRIFVQADRGFIGLVNERGVLIPRWTKMRREEIEDTIRVSRTITRQVLTTREAILSSDAANDSRFDMSQSIADFRIRSMMCAPLLNSQGDAIGVLQIDTLDQRQRFQDEDLELLVSAASQAAIAIDNARLHENALKQKTLERDLNLAHEVQAAFLPKEPPQIDGYEFYDYYQAANQVGGDYYDYLFLPGDKVAIVVADVVGHGVAAAMLMAKLSAEVRFCLARETKVAGAVTQLNQRLCSLRIDRFVTLMVAILDPQTGKVEIANAGHVPALYRQAAGSMKDIGKDRAGVPLGIVDQYEYQQVDVTLAPGESLTILTDGFPEAMDAHGEQYGMKRLREQLANCRGNATDLGLALLSDVRQHLDGEPQDDDMCLSIVRRSS